VSRAGHDHCLAIKESHGGTLRGLAGLPLRGPVGTVRA
jgi:hypothetical protein